MTVRSPLKTVDIASGDTSSAEVDLGAAYGWLMVWIGNFTGTTFTITTAPTSGGTFLTLDKPEAGGAMALPKAKASAVRLGGVQFLKIVSSSAEGSAREVYIQGFNP